MKRGLVGLAAATVATALASRCMTCGREPKRVNSETAECSHTDCPHRRTAWSERPFQGREATSAFLDELSNLEPPAPKPEPLRRKSAKYRREKGMPR